ncbi:MAG: hypothetical protein A2142_06550 [candidate division Zixibacteria bacterium RBG_16_48_11]|nr:MAG: hypothetical protein A2142_06550 [candidate division Zixibacteria bacterium RBG_16_48_11]
MSRKVKNALKRKIFKLEATLMKTQEQLGKLKQQLPKEEVRNYTFKTWSDKPVRLSQLFGNKKDLILVHNMGKRCRYCTMWADGFNGVRDHLENRAGFVVNSPDPPAVQKKFATGRSWKFKMVSSYGKSFNRDLGFEGDKKDPRPGVSTFYKKNGKIYRIRFASFGEGDSFCAVWHFLDLLADGRNGWEPKYKY